MIMRGLEWKNNGSIYILQTQFFRLKKLIDEIINQEKNIEPEIEILQKELDSQGKYPDFDDLNRYMDYMQRRSKSIIGIHEVYILLDVITLMICIELEMRINKFCYYNIGEETTESIESLSLIKKLTVVHSILGKLPFKGTNIYELLREFVGWRNKYVHGKRPEIKHNEIHKNHFKESGDFKNIYDTVKEIIQRGEKFIEISEYLTENSISEYGKIMSCEDDDIKFVLDYTKKNYLSVY